MGVRANVKCQTKFTLDSRRPHRLKILAPLPACPQPFGRSLRFRPGLDTAILPGCGQAFWGAVC